MATTQEFIYRRNPAYTPGGAEPEMLPPEIRDVDSLDPPPGELTTLEIMNAKIEAVAAKLGVDTAAAVEQAKVDKAE